MRFLVPCLLFLLLATPAAALPRPSAVEIARLVEQLGSPSFPEREEASRRLEALGDKALPALQKAARAAKDAEVRRRAGNIVEVALSRAVDSQLKRFKGMWLVGKAEYPSQPEKPEGKGARLDAIEVLEEGGRSIVHLATVDKKTFRLQVDYRLGLGGTVDVYFAKNSIKGIYRLEGDALRLCLSLSGGPRPESFEARKGESVAIYTLKRQKP
jgi:uncharacterized protein (TIGR03067 family)